MPAVSGTESQFRFIDLVVAFEGSVSNRRLRDHFGVSSVQASRILAGYRAKHPRRIAPGGTPGTYSSGSQRSAQPNDVGEYMRLVAPSDPCIEIADARYDWTKVDPVVYRTVHHGLRDQVALEINYRSMNHPAGLERIVHPTAVAFAGRRWHLRAYDEHSRSHRDFNLARIASVGSVGSRDPAPIDEDWEQLVEAHVVAHPALSFEQQSVIRDELFGGTAGRIIRCRRALLPYALRELEIAELPDEMLPPDYQLALYAVKDITA